MNTVYVKLRMKENTNKYRKMLSTEENLYSDISELVKTAYNYVAGAVLEEGEWFKISDASQQSYAIDLISEDYETVDFESLLRDDFKKIDYIFVKDEKTIFFQNVSRTKLASKKKLGRFGESFIYESNSEEVVINEYPDAMYCCENDVLYFRKIEPIVGIFKGIAELYREATDDETENFLNSDFISLTNDFGTANVKTANRKRIAMAVKTFSELSLEDKSNIFAYIGDYCPELKTEDNTFSVGSEDDLKMVLYGIEQRFYTTPIGGEKRIANSVIPLGQK